MSSEDDSDRQQWETCSGPRPLSSEDERRALERWLVNTKRGDINCLVGEWCNSRVDRLLDVEESWVFVLEFAASLATRSIRVLESVCVTAHITCLTAGTVLEIVEFEFVNGNVRLRCEVMVGGDRKTRFVEAPRCYADDGNYQCRYPGVYVYHGVCRISNDVESTYPKLTGYGRYTVPLDCTTLNALADEERSVGVDELLQAEPMIRSFADFLVWTVFVHHDGYIADVFDGRLKKVLVVKFIAIIGGEEVVGTVYMPERMTPKDSQRLRYSTGIIIYKGYKWKKSEKPIESVPDYELTFVDHVMAEHLCAGLV